jgi:HPt (histidine-containing phosphotransfer) domain-containing protein
MAKPFGRNELAELIKSLQGEPLYSSFSGDPAMADLIDSFVTSLPASIKEIEVALVKNELEQLEFIARKLKAQGTSCGFEPITEVASSLEKTVQNAQSLEVIRSDVDAFIKLCLQARTTNRTG